MEFHELSEYKRRKPHNQEAFSCSLFFSRVCFVYIQNVWMKRYSCTHKYSHVSWMLCYVAWMNRSVHECERMIMIRCIAKCLKRTSFPLRHHLLFIWFLFRHRHFITWMIYSYLAIFVDHYTYFNLSVFLLYLRLRDQLISFDIL